MRRSAMCRLQAAVLLGCLHISSGGHTWINWRHYLNDLVPLLFRAAPQNL